MDIKIHIGPSTGRYWRQLGQTGMQMAVMVQCPIRRLLHTELEFSLEYIEKRVDTVFLNGQPVDDIDSTHVPDNARIALASALPGAAGIAMRRNSPYAALRGGITHSTSSKAPPVQGHVELVLFTHIMHDHTLRLLGRGAGIKTPALTRMLVQASHAEVAAIFLDGAPAQLAHAVEALKQTQLPTVLLTLEQAEGQSPV